MNDAVQEKVFERIKSGQARMHSRAYFAARIAAAAAVALFALSISAFALSFIAFSVHESGEQFLLGFGSRGLATFLALFPWNSLAAAVAAIFMLEWLLQGFKIGYRVSLLSVFCGALATSAALGALVALTPLHGMLQDRADRGALPLGGEFYEAIRDSHQPQGIFRGTVASIGRGSIVIGHQDGDRDPDDGTWTVALPSSAPPLSIGDRVYVFGTSTGRVVEAYGIETLSLDQ